MIRLFIPRLFILCTLFLQMSTTPVYGAVQEQVESTPVTLTIFHSTTCPHCRAELAFLDSIDEKYPALRIEKYEVSDPATVPIMREYAKRYGAERNLGNVPLTFIGEQYFVGYESDITDGRKIEQAIRVALKLEESKTNESTVFTLPLIGTIDASQHSLAALAVTLGLLDGVNVCSLGALVLIIGLTLKLQRRRAIVLFGGAFIFITALVYGALIVLWYQIFDVFTAYMTALKVGVALLSLGGGLYFLKEYLRMRRQGAVCEMQESPLINRLMDHTSRAFEDKTKLLGVLGAVVLFAAVLAIVEFPCSAAVPVVFAGVLANAGLSTASYLMHIALFVLFYMLDELIVFGVAAYKLKVWMMDGSFTKIAALAEALILLGIGVWYLGAVTGLF